MVLTRGEHFHSEIPGTEVTQVCLGEAASDARRGRGRTTSPLCKQARVPPTAAARPPAPWPSQGSTPFLARTASCPPQATAKGLTGWEPPVNAPLPHPQLPRQVSSEVSCLCA